MPHSTTRNAGKEGGSTEEPRATGEGLDLVASLLQGALAGAYGDFGPVDDEDVQRYLEMQRRKNTPAAYLNVGDESNPLTR